MKLLKQYGLILAVIVLFMAAKSVNKNYKLALKFYYKGEYSTALSKVDLAIAQGKTTESMWLKGYILAAMENHNRAVFFLGYKLKPGNEPDGNLIALGDSYYELGNYEMAKNCYQKAKELDMRGFNNLGTTYYRLNENDSAIYYWTRVIEMDSTKAFAYFGRGIAHDEEMRMGCACRDYQKACELGVANACEALEKQNCLSWKHEWGCK